MIILLILITILIVLLIRRNSEKYCGNSHSGHDGDRIRCLYPPKVHVLHPGKTGGLSLRKAIGCDCAGPIDGAHGETEKGTAACGKTSTKGRFICHGHYEYCDDIPKDEPYVVIVRDPEDRAISFSRFIKKQIPDFMKTKYAVPLSKYTDCPGHPPDMILRTEHLDEDYQEFKKRYCAPGECADHISHYHDSKNLPSGYKEFKVKFGDAERALIRNQWPDDYRFSKDN